MIPGNSSSPSLSIRRKLSRISCLTVFETQPVSRSSFKFEGRTLAAIAPLSPSVACSQFVLYETSFNFIVGDRFQNVGGCTKQRPIGYSKILGSFLFRGSKWCAFFCVGCAWFCFPPAFSISSHVVSPANRHRRNTRSSERSRLEPGPRRQQQP